MEQNIIVVKYISEATKLMVDIREKQNQEEVRAVDIPLGCFPMTYFLQVIPTFFLLPPLFKLWIYGYIEHVLCQSRHDVIVWRHLHRHFQKHALLIS